MSWGTPRRQSMIEMDSDLLNRLWADKIPSICNANIEASDQHESNHFHCAFTRRLECVYDVRLVRPLEESRLKAADRRDSCKLGHCIFRVSAAGAGKPHW